MNKEKCFDNYGNFNINLKYAEIIKLNKLLTQSDIPHTFRKLFDGWQILYPEENNIVASVIEHFGSYGSEEDLLEIMGLLTTEEKNIDSVKGFLTANEVFERIKKHYNNKIKGEKI